MHYRRLRRNGDPTIVRRTPSSVFDDFIYGVAVPYDRDDCLLWPYPGVRSSKGYAYIDRGGKRRGVHRLLCEIKHGPPPTPKHVAAHSCGKGHLGCVNPKHLRWATGKENRHDMIAHGTAPRGQRQALAILTEESVREIRAWKGVIRGCELAKLYGVSQTTITNVQIGRAHV